MWTNRNLKLLTLHSSSDESVVLPSLPPVDINNQLLCLAEVEAEAVVCAAVCKQFDLLHIGCLVVVAQARHSGVVCELDD